MSNRDEQADLAKLANAFFANLSYDPSCEYGSISIDCKRPFGNSFVEGDILELIGAKPEGDGDDRECWSHFQRDYAALLYQEKLVPYLRVKWARFTNTPLGGK